MQRRKRSESTTAVQGGHRWTAEEARQILEEWSTSGETLNAFAKGRGLVPQRLWWWQKRLGERRRPAAEGAPVGTAPAFLPVTVRPLVGEAVLATVAIVGGLRVELHALDDASAIWVASLARALGGAS